MDDLKLQPQQLKNKPLPKLFPRSPKNNRKKIIRKPLELFGDVGNYSTVHSMLMPLLFGTKSTNQ